MRTFIYLLIFVAASVGWAAEPDGRLPRGVKPVKYSLRLEPDAERAVFSGRVEVEMELAQPSQELVLNSLGLRITSAKVDDVAWQAKADDVAQTLTLNGAQVGKGAHRLVIEFSGALNERPEGLFLTRYQNPDGSWQKALVTQMEPADARRMFPCWDEPGYRSAFQLTALVPAGQTALFNMSIERETPRDGGKKEVVFGTTPPMASYLVAFVSAELESIEDEVAGVKLRVLGTKGKRSQMRYAMEATKKVLPWYNEYFGVKYPLPKLDQVAFPSVGASGMENWGCIIYADTALLFDEKQGSQSSGERVFGVVAHEIAHQWFGDLITMEWWNDLWLNEGFASWMATKVGAHFNPSWKKWERAADSKEVAMRLDARATTHPIQQEVRSAGEAMRAFDEITYQKGQAFLRMLESWLGEEKFRAGLRRYFAEHANSNTTTADLWKSLSQESGQNVAQVARGWTEQPGFPLVTARAAGEGKIEFSQERFTIHQKGASALRWQIPVLIQPVAEEAKPRVVLLGEETERTGSPLPVVVNAGAAGYFRVHYEGAAWEALLPRLSALAEADRLTVLRDTWALVQAGRVPLDRWLKLAELLRDDISPLIGSQILGVIGSLDHLAAGSPERVVLRSWAREFLKPAWGRLGWEARAGEDLATASYRADLVSALGDFGAPTILIEAHARAQKFLQDPASLPGDLRSAVLHIAGREADADFWESLHTLAKSTPDTEQKNILYGALAAVQNPVLAAQTLRIALAGELPSKLAERFVGRVAAEGEQAELAWEFAKAHLEELLALCSAGDASDFLARLARNFSVTTRAEELEAITRTSLPPDAARNAAIAADEIRFKAEFKATVLPELAAWIAARQGGR